MKSIATSLLAAGFLLVVVASSALPAVRESVGGRPKTDGVLWGELLDLPANGTLLIDGAARGYFPKEVDALRSFVARGGRLVMAGVTPASASLLNDLDIGIEATPFLLFDPDLDSEGRFALSATGALGLTETQWAGTANIVLGGGQALLVSNPFSWLDRDADGLPDLDEPRGAWAVARIAEVGLGQVLVLGNREFLFVEPAAGILQTWLTERGPLLVDDGHRTAPDAFGAVSLLAGHQDGLVVLIILVGGALSAGVAWRLWIRRVWPPRRRGRVDSETLEMLAELPT